MKKGNPPTDTDPIINYAFISGSYQRLGGIVHKLNQNLNQLKEILETNNPALIEQSNVEPDTKGVQAQPPLPSHRKS